MTDTDRERWRRLQEIVADAIEMDPDRRADFLRRECAGDELLLREAESLLRAYDRAHGSITDPGPVELTVPRPPSEAHVPLRLVPGDRVGPYVIREFIDEGAFGEVYVAERTSPMRARVALKIVKRGMDTSQVLARFEAERQALALMSHNCIARIYDAGTTEQGRAYFAMEYVPGLPLTEHCDRHRLAIDERLELFVRICEAVQHAHQKGVVHRDLKPSNVLVTYEDDHPLPKIIDFGVAKALNQPLTERSIYTDTGQIVGTPAYMSPEQADPSLQDIDTRSDVYSLGVLLYQLLTGLLPFDLRQAGFQEMRRLIREVDPPRPSTKLTTGAGSSAESLESARNRRLDLPTLTRRVRGDLDWITMKCLEKDRRRRYASADALAKEILRHLRDEPLQETGPPSLLYRARKFVRRNRSAVIATALVLAVLLAGVVAVSISEGRRLALRAENARYQARESLEAARSLFYGHFYEVDAGSAPVRGLFGDDLQRTLAQARAKDPRLDEADVLAVHALLLSGGREAAEARAREALRRHPGSEKLRAMLAGLRGEEPEPDRPDSALRHDHRLYYRALATEDHPRAIDLLEQSLQVNPWYFDAQWQLAVRRYALRDDEGMLRDATLLTRVEPDRAIVWDLKGTALAGLGRLEDAADAYTEAIARDERIWRGYYGRAWVRHREKKYGQALDDLALARERNPRSGSVSALEGAALVRLNRLEPALAAYDRAIEQGADGWWVWRDRADVRRVLKRREEALDDVNEAFARMSGGGTDVTALVIRGDLLRDLRRMDEARADLERALELDPDYERAHFKLGRLHLLEGRYDDALRSFDEAVRLRTGAGWEIGRGMARMLAGDAPAALADLRPLAAKDGYHWVRLWIWEIEASRGDASAAATALATARAADVDDEPIYRRVVDFLAGTAEVSDVLRLARTDKQRLYAHYFLGARARLDGRIDEAIEHYHEALEPGLVGELEHDLAECRLRGLVAEVH